MPNRIRPAAASSSVLCEQIEPRRLLAAATVVGTNGADEIRMTTTESEILVDVNGDLESYSTFFFDAVSISGANGADQIFIDANAGASVTVNGGGGSDVIHLAEAGDDLGALPEAVSVLSAGDELVLHDAASFAQSYVVDNGRVTRGGFGGVGYSVGRVRLTSGAGADDVDVVRTSGATLILDAGAGANRLDIAADGGTSAEVALDADARFARIFSAPGGSLTLLGDAGLELTTNQSNVEGNVTIGTGYIVERNSQGADGVGYWRERIGNAADGSGPTLSSAFAATSATSDTVGYAYAQNLTIDAIDGLALADGDLLLRYALRGDADLDRDVDFADLVRLAQNYNTVAGANWHQGDFDVSRSVNFADLVGLAQNYNQSAAVTQAKRGASPARRAVDDVVK